MSHATEKYSICPYNKAHIILRYRMHTHLVKCRKQHATLDWGRCTHNSNHEMPRIELQQHEDHECPDRHSFQASIVNFKNEEFQSLAPIIHTPVPVAPTDEENWDDGPVNFFDPKENARQKSIIRGVHCVPPAERKAFKFEHRRNLQEREEDPSYMGVTKAKVKVEPMKAPQLDAPFEPLRQPKQLPKGFTLGRGQTPASTLKSSTSANTAAPAAPAAPAGVRAPLHGVQWSGLGRGSIPEAQLPTSLPPAGAWGRGKPRI